ncbi:MAG: flagellar basal body-associated FliL family protein [Ilumatobacteraceae bacterium]|nr:flagellar basal body-associated FliL family protein [Ilumatobacteraceae bacterium]
MATKPAAAETAQAPAKSKKMLIIIVAVVLLLVLGGGAFLFISKQRAAAAAAEEEGGEPAAAAHAAPDHGGAKTPPVYLPMDNMVVNLADPGGERVAQVGITLEVRDAKAADSVKAFMPTIRSGVLMLLSQRTSENLLSPEGKHKLIEDILREASVPFGGDPAPEDETAAPKKKPKKKVTVQYPVVDVLFSSLIVQ